MKQENKELILILIKDLCARLPYGVRGKVKADTVVPNRYDIDGFPLETTFDVDVELQRIDVSNNEIFVSTFDNDEDLGNYIEECQIEGTPWTIEEFTPYLRPMSSMTDDERKEYNDIVKNTIDFYNCPKSEKICFFIIPIEWLNKHHFDYHGLIERGLALEASKEIYNIT